MLSEKGEMEMKAIAYVLLVLEMISLLWKDKNIV
jgi:hypothetical protein|tara:strand:- start:127 stop:228 length:102 start_codon:yes stop_codon:yes gene_type:complete